jgi:hypothetical protein
MSSPSTISVAENGEVTLQCHAKGFPTPNVEWRREDNLPIRLRSRGTGEHCAIPLFGHKYTSKLHPWTKADFAEE